MKLQIIVKPVRKEVLNQNDRNISQLVAIQQKSRQIIHNYLPIKQIPTLRSKATDRQTPFLRDFFNNFDSCCKVEYQPVNIAPQESKRKLEPLLNASSCPSEELNKSPQFSLKKDAIPVTFNISSYLSSKQPMINNTSSNSSTMQKPHRRLKKIISLSSFHQEAKDNTTKILSGRKPGFIRLYKSQPKREPNFQISKIAQPNNDANNNRSNSLTMPPSPRACSVSLSILDSKERIAKIRRELTEIYLMRQKPTYNRLKLQ